MYSTYYDAFEHHIYSPMACICHGMSHSTTILINFETVNTNQNSEKLLHLENHNQMDSLIHATIIKHGVFAIRILKLRFRMNGNRK